MGTICKVGETKTIQGKVYRKTVPGTSANGGECSGCAFEDRACPGRSAVDPIEDGGCECRGSVWRRVRVSTPIDRAKTPKAKATKKHVWTPKSFMPNPRSTKAHLEQLLSATVSQLNELGTENAKLRNQIASLKKKGSK